LEIKGSITGGDMKTFFYYDRDDKNRPIGTICFATDGKRYARGVAVCSENDNPCKKTGRRIAQSRALKAFYANKHKGGKTPYGGLFFKSDPAPGLNRLERKFVASVQKCE
jgi:hypothetical protein